MTTTKKSIVFCHGIWADGSYILAKNDRTVHPELQRFLAKRMGATIHEVESSHVPTAVQPQVCDRCDPCRGERLTRRCSQPLAGVQLRLSHAPTSHPAATRVLASGG